MQAFNNMASSGLVTRKFTRYRANTRESTSYMTETDYHPTESYRNRIVSMRSVSNFLLEFENKSAVSFV